MDHKQNILDALSVMRDSVKIEGNIFKLRSYEKVIKNIANITEPILSFEQIEVSSGAGDKIKLKLKEIIETGHLKQADKISKRSDVKIKNELMQVYGIGPKKAIDLVEKHEIYSVEDLRKKSKLDDKLLTTAQKIGLECYEDLLERIPRSEMLQHQKILNLSLEKGEITGSFRRGNDSSGDIDALLNMNSEEFKKYINNLQKKKYLIHILAEGDRKMLGVCRLKNGKYRRLDLIRTDKHEYPYMLLYFTGSAKFNVAFRQHCLNVGYSLNEHSFTPNVIGLETEKDIFDYLNIKYIEPEKRVDISSIIKK